ncbi:hypothetical protein NP493_359g06011 [Ridgeia piscesae]|uniref:Superoxide dismutase copper/zinc binding domain-containing protein n=1 Tax=Ridgeia piscesae TaxID=27915 RepID=A0AAD9L2Y8_RIDPI|nr:hypothetical protein NP493_359g06011 [Ridgeia piscesae]
MGSVTEKGPQSLGAAVSMILGDTARGVMRFVQVDPDTCVMEGTIDGLSPGAHGLFIHELGDVSRGCASCGEVFDSRGQSGGKKAGDLGLVTATEEGRAKYRLNTSRIKIWNVIGRSVVIHTAEERVACGIIARSSGLFENDKRICACDGVTLWDERDVPIAGPGRSRLKTHVNTNATCCDSGTAKCDV